MPARVARPTLLILVATFGLLTSLAACSAIVHPDSGSLGPTPVACTPGLQVSCPCVGGATGQQLCNYGGSFDPCVCPSGGAGASGH